MSTNNNLLGKECKPVWKNDAAAAAKIVKLTGSKVQSLASNDLSEVTALTLSERGIAKMEDFLGFSDKLHRVDLSSNAITRLHGFDSVPSISMLNVSSNQLVGDASLEDLRYLVELRLLNIGNNPKIKHVRSHVVKPLGAKLQALIANECGFEKTSFLKFLPHLNTLVLSKNALADFSAKDVGTFASLSKLSIGHNKLTAVPDLRTSPLLVELRLNNNAISVVPDHLFALKKLKTLDLSSNRVNKWDEVRKLPALTALTNLAIIKGNALPEPPDNVEEIELREDKASDTIQDAMERRYRHYVLSMFQRRVGAQNKLFVQLIVLDMRRVKMKFSYDYGGVEQGKDRRDGPKKGGGSGGSGGSSDVPVPAKGKEAKKDRDGAIGSGSKSKEGASSSKGVKTDKKRASTEPSEHDADDADDDVDRPRKKKKKSKDVDAKPPATEAASRANQQPKVKRWDDDDDGDRDGDGNVLGGKMRPPKLPKAVAEKKSAADSAAMALAAVAGSGVVSVVIHEKPPPLPPPPPPGSAGAGAGPDAGKKAKKAKKGDVGSGVNLSPPPAAVDLSAVLAGRRSAEEVGVGGSSAW